MKNRKIRERAISRGVKLWEIANALGVTDSTFSKKLRFEFTDEETTQILQIIDELAKNREV